MEEGERVEKGGSGRRGNETGRDSRREGEDTERERL